LATIVFMFVIDRAISYKMSASTPFEKITTQALFRGTLQNSISTPNPDGGQMTFLKLVLFPFQQSAPHRTLFSHCFEARVAGGDARTLVHGYTWNTARRCWERRWRMANIASTNVWVARPMVHKK
jgi:hypothetical protein